jgi:hypothetical protein
MASNRWPGGEDDRAAIMLLAIVDLGRYRLAPAAALCNHHLLAP